MVLRLIITHEFINEVYNIVGIMGFSMVEKAVLVAY